MLFEKMPVKYLLFLLFGYIFVIVLCSKRVNKSGIKISLSNVDLETDSEYILMNITLHNNTIDPLIDIDADLLKPLGTNLFIQSIIQTKMGSQWQTMANTGQTNLCTFLKHPEKEPFLRLLFLNFKEYGNLIASCPVEKGHYFLKKFKLNTTSIPSFTPAGQYLVKVQLSQKIKNEYKLVYKMIWHATVTKI